MRVVSFGRRLHNIVEIFRFRLAHADNRVRYRSLAGTVGDITGGSKYGSKHLGG